MNHLNLLYQKISQIQQQIKLQRYYYLGTVTGTDPELQVTLDGDDQPLPYEPVSLTSVLGISKDKRVVLSVINKRFCITGIIGDPFQFETGAGMIQHDNNWHSVSFETVSGATGKANAARDAAITHANTAVAEAYGNAIGYTDQAVAGIELQPGPPGTGLEFIWNGTQLGVRLEGQSEFQYVDLQGIPGDPGEMPAHEWNGTEIRFQNQDGSWGDWVDLKGEPGDDAAIYEISDQQHGPRSGDDLHAIANAGVAYGSGNHGFMSKEHAWILGLLLQMGIDATHLAEPETLVLRDENGDIEVNDVDVHEEPESRKPVNVKTMMELAAEIEPGAGMAEHDNEYHSREFITAQEAPVQPEQLSYTHHQDIPSSTWTINHGLGYYPAVSVRDNTGRKVEGAVRYPDINTVIVEYSAEFSGKADLS